MLAGTVSVEGQVAAEGAPLFLDGGGFPPGKVNFGLAVASLVDNVLVNNPACRNLVTGAAPRNLQNAFEVWNAVEITRAAAPDSDSPTANADAHFNQGSNGTITIYPPYYAQKGSDVFGYIPPHNGISRFPTDIEMQARTALPCLHTRPPKSGKSSTCGSWKPASAFRGLRSDTTRSVRRPV